MLAATTQETIPERKRKLAKKKKLTRATSAQRNKHETAKTDVRHIRDKGGTHQIREPDKKSNLGRPPKDQGPDWNQNPPRVCKIEWAYRPTVDERNDMNEEITPVERDQDQTVKEAKVSHEYKVGETYLKVSRYQNCNGGGPWKGQELCGKLETHRAHKPDGGFKEKNKETEKKNKRETHLEKWESRRKEEIRGGGPEEGREPRPRTKLNWACRPTSGRNKNKVPPVCHAISGAAIRLAEPQYDWRCRSAADPIFSSRNKSDQSEPADKHHTGKIKVPPVCNQ